MNRRTVRARIGLLGGVVGGVGVIALLLTPASTASPVGDVALTPAQQAVSSNVNALISKMTLAEKFGQIEMFGASPGPAPDSLMTAARNGQVGSVLDLTGVDNINQVQQAALQSRLHIPLIFALDVIHGYKTIFPVPIMEASSWDPAAAANDESISASEATADGLKWTFNPMVDISRDARWGRVVEGAGEDPFLGSAMAAAKVAGYQGNDFGALDKMAATVKHFAAYGAPVAGREYNAVDMSEQQLRNDYLPTYKAATGAGAASVMSAFNSLNGVPASANPYLLQTILRQEWGFGGTVVSDYQAVDELVTFGYAATPADAAKLALTAGVDIDMGVDFQHADYENYGPQLVQSGQLSMATVDNAVRHVLTLKYLAGVFARPFTDPTRVQTAELTDANLAAARTMAARSMVLLNNCNTNPSVQPCGQPSGTPTPLPLSPAVPSIAVVGPLADNQSDQLGPDVPGGYDITQGKVVSVLNGIKAAVPGAAVNYVQGCDWGSGPGSPPPPPTYCASTAGFPAAVSAAKASAVTVIVVGEPAAYSGEASSRSDISLPGQQLALIQAIAATGKPYVVVLMNGRPLTISWLADNAPAVLESWFPGTEGGNAVADVLFGKVNPGGKLPMSFPRDVGQIPISYNELPTGRPFDPNNKYTSKYLDVLNTPQYPFGFGLSYSTFKLSNLKLSSGSISAKGTLTVSADITNTGTVAGDDVAQLYIHDQVASVLQPVRRLDGFQRITLASGQTRTVTFTLNKENLGFYNNQGQFVVEPGQFDVWIGDSSVGGMQGEFLIK